MNKIYIVHCWDGSKNDGWYPWLDKKISNSNNEVIRFDMPNTATPKIEEWILEIKNEQNIQKGRIARGTTFICNNSLLPFVDNGYYPI